MVTGGQRAYAIENLLADLDCLIRRFLPRETSGFKNVEERNLSRGLIGHSQHKDTIIDSFKKHCTSAHPVAGNLVYTVDEKARQDFLFYVGNGVHTGEIALLKDDLLKKLALDS